MLTRYEFETLRVRQANPRASQRAIAQEAGISLGSVNKAVHELEAAGLLNEAGEPTAAAQAALAPYRVGNAIILAAGVGARIAPFSFERPKAMFEVHGQVLIERLIEQLHAAGIHQIVIVVGYMKEAFFYLEERYGVTIVVNTEYATRNNHSSLWAARRFLGNSLIISSDQYFTKNIFPAYSYESWCTVSPLEASSNEETVVVDSAGRVLEVREDATGDYLMQGPCYLDRAFCETYLSILQAEYANSDTASKLWEAIFSQHAQELPMAVRLVEPGVIQEFDYLADLTAFDRDFFANVDSRILDNICKTLHCQREHICDVRPVKAGLTNLSTVFAVEGKRYIYRHPGTGTDKIINREAEAFALTVARDLGLDDTFIYEDPVEGWKISRFVDGCSELDYANRGQVSQALSMARTLHTSGKVSPWSFDFFSEGVKIAGLLRGCGYPLPRDFDELMARVEAIATRMRSLVKRPVLCHNDFYGPNFLVRGDEMRLIDWEYAAMGDPICDLGNFVAQGSGYSVEETLDILPLYYGREATAQEQWHALAAVCVVGWYWYVWAMYKEALGNPVGQWLYTWYKAAVTFGKAAEKRLQQAPLH